MRTMGIREVTLMMSARSHPVRRKKSCPRRDGAIPLDDLIDGSVNGQAGGVEQPGVGLLPERCHRAGGIALVHGGQLRAIGRVEDGRVRMETVFPQGVEGARR